jgi:hypothetical protein
MEPMSKRKRILVSIGITVIVAGTCLHFYGFQTMAALIVRYQCRKIPEMAKTPVALTDLSVSDVPHRKVSYFGYEFELPWDDIDEQKDKTVGQIHVGAFHSGNAFWFSTFPPKNFLSLVMKDTKLDPQSFRQMFGDEAFESDYGFHKRMLQVTPGEITPFVSRRQAAAAQLLLLFKGTSMPKAASGIFAIQTRDFEGFQFENPQSRPFRITDELYSNDGGIDVIFFQKIDGSAPAISQSEINRVIQSIHKVATQAAASNVSGEK